MREVIRAAGLELSFQLSKPEAGTDDHDLALIRRSLMRTPEERFSHGQKAARETNRLWRGSTPASRVCPRPPRALPDGYDDLRRGATAVELADGLVVQVASLADVIRSKEAAGREKDRAQLPLMRRTLEEIRQTTVSARPDPVHHLKPQRKT